MNSNLIDQIKAKRPLVLAVTNFITAGEVANVLSAAGMSPMMPSDPHEATELTAIADAVTINIGSVDSDQVALIDAVMATASALQKPVVLDPVAVSTSQARQNLVQAILKRGVSLIRGNASEIAYLAGSKSQARGIDAGDENNPAQLAQLCAQKHQCIVVLSGPIDYVSDGQTTVGFATGSPMMPKVVGTGDMLSAFLSGCLTLPVSLFEAAQFGTAYFGRAGQKADIGGLGAWSSNILTVLDQASTESWKGVIEMKSQFPQALTIAGSDSGGGAGMQADLKTMQMRHVFGASIVVAVTAQNTLGVNDAFILPKKIIDEQFEAVADDMAIKAVKSGMLADSDTVRVVAENLRKFDFGPYILDPVMVAKGGAHLLTDDAVATVKRELLPLASLVTPNLPEAEVLTGIKIQDQKAMRVAAEKLQALGAKNVLVKGGHLGAETVASDYVLLADGTDFWLSGPRFETTDTHGTGDTISACIAAELAKGSDLKTAIRIGKAYVTATIRDGIKVGHGHGPLNHWAGGVE